MVKLFLCTILLLVCSNANAQDTMRTLNAEQVLQIVKQYHPIAKQALIEVKKAQADVLISRSAFDPVVNYYSTSKTFNGTNYYNYTASEVKVPTWYGVEVYAGLENLTGNRLDNAQTNGKTTYVGISVPLVKNLVIDKRRAFLQQAKIFKEMAEMDKRSAINDLSINAMIAYWHWVNAYQTYLVVKNNVEINEKRFLLMKKSLLNGERPAIDTVEALTQLQSFKYLQNENWLEFQNAGLQLSAYLWDVNNQPYYLPENIVPQSGWENEMNISKFNLDIQSLLATAQVNHPDLKFYDYKLDALSVEKRLKFQELLPKVDFRYNQLGKGYDVLGTATIGPLFENNYQYGLKIEIPLRLSQGRGDFEKAKLKIEETILSQNRKTQEIEIKVKSYYNELQNLKQQIVLQSNNYSNYSQLIKAEETRFYNGESSLFIINSRENKALEALEKLIELKTKYYKTIYALQWSAGLLQ